jgi:hypothetical protein
VDLGEHPPMLDIFYYILYFSMLYMHASWKALYMWTYSILTWLLCLFLVVHPHLEICNVLSILFLDEGELS